MEQRFDTPNLKAHLTFADEALSRIAGAPLLDRNHVRLLKDAAENYPAWIQAMETAERHIHFESFIFHDDEVGAEFADILIRKARQGIRVRLIYDWMGGIRTASRRFWSRLRGGGVEVRCYNPPRFDSPLGWLSRDHRKMLAVDGRVGFIAGLCVGKMWIGYPEKNIDPWRDTGVEVSGPAVGEIERSFREIWAMLGKPVPAEGIAATDSAEAGNMKVRIVASFPATASMIRMDQFIAALARKRLWLSDAYYAGTTSYVQALRSAALDEVDVRLLVPGSTDISLLRPLSRTGYRALLEAGVRVFEWNGSMMHAKTAVADGLWARVGSTNLNLASWYGNCELDAVIEDESFAQQMEAMYLDDLMNATEVVLDARRKVRPSDERSRPMSEKRRARKATGRARRAAAGAVRLSNVIGAAFTSRRPLEPVEARALTSLALFMLTLSVFFGIFPKALVYPLVVIVMWIALGLLYRAVSLYRKKRRKRSRL